MFSWIFWLNQALLYGSLIRFVSIVDRYLDLEILLIMC
jgi:hypothetical protein